MPMADSNIKMVSVNCQGLGSKKKRQDIFSYYKENKFNIICMVDTHISGTLKQNVYSEWGNQAHFTFYSSNSRGVAILFNKLDYKIHNEKKTDDGNLISLDLTVEETRMSLICVYGPNNDCPSFYANLNSIINDFSNKHLIICGDFKKECDNY